MACYNGQEFVRPCLESLVTHDYPPELFEVLFMDDGSDDDSLRIAEKFQSRFKNLRLNHTGNCGLEATCNAGYRLAEHDCVLRVDVDDMLAQDYLKRMDMEIRRHPGYDFYYSKNYYEYYSEAEKHLKTLPDFNRDEIFQRGDFFATGTVYYKKDILDVGGYPSHEKNCGLENYYLTLRLLSAGKKGFAVDGAIFFYRRHHSNMSTIKRTAIISFGQELLKSYGRLYTTNENHPYGLKL